MDFNQHKEQTAGDCEAVAEILTNLAAEIREGNLSKFGRFWIEAGTDEGDARIFAIREQLILRYLHRHEQVNE